MSNFKQDMSPEDYEYITSSLHEVCPQSRGYIIYGIEEALPFDRSMVFHLRRLGSEDITKVIMLSYDYIMRQFPDSNFESDEDDFEHE